MLAMNYIEGSVPYLRMEDSIAYALTLMEDNKMPALPLVLDGDFVGIITEDQLLDATDDKADLSVLRPKFEGIKVKKHDHLFEIIKTMSDYGLLFVSVVDESNKLLGVITTEKIIKILGQQTSMMEPGGILVLEMKSTDYSHSEISRIVESNDANILHSFVSGRSDVGMLQVTLKVNRTNLKDIISSFERYDYKVTASFHESDTEDRMKERLDAFMHYFNI